MEPKKRSPLIAIVLAVVIGLMVIALLNGVIRPTQIVVAKSAIAPGTILSEALVELRTIPMGARPADALTKMEDAVGKMLAVGRAPGDFIVQSVLGEIAGAGIPAELPEGHVALAIHVNQASGIAGLLRPGQTVTIVGMLSPDLLSDNPVSVMTGPLTDFGLPTEIPAMRSSRRARSNAHQHADARTAAVPAGAIGRHRRARPDGAAVIPLRRSAGRRVRGSTVFLGANHNVRAGRFGHRPGCADNQDRGGARIMGRSGFAAGGAGPVWHDPSGAGTCRGPEYPIQRCGHAEFGRSVRSR